VEGRAPSSAQAAPRSLLEQGLCGLPDEGVRGSNPAGRRHDTTLLWHQRAIYLADVLTYRFFASPAKTKSPVSFAREKRQAAALGRPSQACQFAVWKGVETAVPKMKTTTRIRQPRDSFYPANHQAWVEIESFLQALHSYPDRFARDPALKFEQHLNRVVNDRAEIGWRRGRSAQSRIPQF
jgi:hypothetical protein